jgi:hypothetical protein
MRPLRWTSGSTYVAARHRALPAWLALVLACAMLWGQWAGLVHRIEHGVGGGTGLAHAVSVHAASVQHERPSARALAGADALAGLHSCVVFDGLCLADSLPAALLPVLPGRVVHAAPPLWGFVSWQASVVLHFESRAPPAA